MRGSRQSWQHISEVHPARHKVPLERAGQQIPQRLLLLKPQTALIAQISRKLPLQPPYHDHNSSRPDHMLLLIRPRHSHCHHDNSQRSLALLDLNRSSFSGLSMLLHIPRYSVHGQLYQITKYHIYTAIPLHQTYPHYEVNNIPPQFSGTEEAHLQQWVEGQ